MRNAAIFVNLMRFDSVHSLKMEGKKYFELYIRLNEVNVAK